jgi:hypothetical protein
MADQHEATDFAVRLDAILPSMPVYFRGPRSYGFQLMLAAHKSLAVPQRLAKFDRGLDKQLCSQPTARDGLALGVDHQLHPWPVGSCGSQFRPRRLR